LANQEQNSTLTDWLNKENFDNEEKVRSITKIFDDLKIYSVTSDKVKNYFEQADMYLKKTGLSENSLMHLKEFTIALSNRDQ